MTRKTSVLVILWTLCFAGLSGCRLEDAKEFIGIKANRTRNIVALIDLSATPQNPDRHQFYQGVITKEIFGNLNAQDRFTVLPIDRSSVTNAEEIFLTDFSKKDFTPEMGTPLEIEKLTKENLEKYKKDVLPELEASVAKAVTTRKALAQQTDIFGALESVRRYTLPDRPTYVIMLSDMMNFTGSFKMEPSNKGFEFAKVDELVRSAPQVDLKGYVVLIMTGDQSENEAAHFRTVREFWLKYFERNGAKLVDYSSASRSKIDELMRTAVARE